MASDTSQISSRRMSVSPSPSSHGVGSGGPMSPASLHNPAYQLPLDSSASNSPPAQSVNCSVTEENSKYEGQL